MKLKTYDKEVCPTLIGKSVNPTVRISFSSKTITLNEPSLRQIGVKKGDKLVLLQDEENPMDWFLEKSESPEAFELIDWNKKGKYKDSTLFIRSTSLVKEVYSALKIEDVKSVTLPLGKSLTHVENGKKSGGGATNERILWPIITAAVKKK